MEFKSYIGYDFGQPEVFFGGGNNQVVDDSPPATIYNTGFEWLGVDGAEATIGAGYIVTFGTLLTTSKEDVVCTGSRDSPGIVFVELKRFGQAYSTTLRCLSRSGFPGHTVDAWRFPIYAVYLSDSGDAAVLHKLTSGLISA